jgi:hypothetical protein
LAHHDLNQRRGLDEEHVGHGMSFPGGTFGVYLDPTDE